IRLLLARSNQALRGMNPSVFTARRLSKEAYERAHELQDLLMMTRAQYRRAEVEQGALAQAEDTWRVCQTAIGFALDALSLAQQLQNARLTARIHTLLGNLYLVFPFQDFDAAAESCEAAFECVSHSQDRD